ncbi:hypothetical protein LTR29_017962 [Friedmanniomyces endolithicus]|nr:hypothetical protein LTR29_017962 [Friedmanniomyces endolithicus]
MPTRPINGPQVFEGTITPVSRPSQLLQSNGKYYERSEPQCQQYRVYNFLSACSLGATGNGHTDDTAALQRAILTAKAPAKAQNKILFVDQDDHLVSGERYSVILSYSNFFNNMNSPQPVVQMGKPGEHGSIEWRDMIVSTQGQRRGAVYVKYNLNSPSSWA